MWCSGSHSYIPCITRMVMTCMELCQSLPLGWEGEVGHERECVCVCVCVCSGGTHCEVRYVGRPPAADVGIGVARVQLVLKSLCKQTLGVGLERDRNNYHGNQKV